MSYLDLRLNFNSLFSESSPTQTPNSGSCKLQVERKKKTQTVEFSLVTLTISILFLK